MVAPEIVSSPAPTLPFNGADWLIFGIIALSVVLSFWRGFVKEAISLTTWVLAFFLAFHCMAAAALWCKPWIASDALRSGVGFAVIFFGVLLVGGVLNYLIGRFVVGTGLSGMDRFLGLGFGFLRGGLLVVIIVILAQATNLNQSEAWRHSLLLPAFVHVTQWLHPFIPLTR